MLNEDYREILQSLLKNKVRFLVIGAYAMGAYGYSRSTGDIDIWVDNSLNNSKKIYKALIDFGAFIGNLKQGDFAKENIVFQIGVAPRRIDILTSIDGVKFKEAYKDKEAIMVDDFKIPFLSKDNLIKNKQATGREKDIVDINYLRQQ
jgi:hypothetical protein